eukprot:605204-Amphidinium_carterae.1
MDGCRWIANESAHPRRTGHARIANHVLVLDIDFPCLRLDCMSLPSKKCWNLTHRNYPSDAPPLYPLLPKKKPEEEDENEAQ